MKFFKQKVKYVTNVITPAAAVWVFTYNIPNAMIESFGQNSTFLENYDVQLHTYIGLAAVTLSMVNLNILYYSCCWNRKGKSEENESYEEIPNDDSNDDLNKLPDECDRLFQYNPYGGYGIGVFRK